MHDIDRTTLEFGQEMGFQQEQFEFGQGEWSGEAGLSESEEIALASELLAVTNENELDHFLGSFWKKLDTPLGRAVGGVLKSVAKKALPLAGGALGGFVGGPLGARIGSGLASAAGSALGLETETEFQGEDREFDGARTFVKLASDTANRAAQARAGDPRQVAVQAATAAARQYAPGLLGNSGQPGGQAARAGANGQRMSGRWVRYGRRIVLHGV